MRKTARFLLLMLGASMVASPCYAEEAFWRGNVPPAQAIRTAQAREWLEGFKALDRQVPTLSPSERGWLKREYDDQIASASGHFTSRAIAAIDSTEYNKRIARERLDNILIGLTTLATSKRLAGQQEIKLWIGLAAAMMDTELWASVKVLVERKLVAAEINGVKDLYLETHVTWAQAILNRVVLPIVEGGAK